MPDQPPISGVFRRPFAEQVAYFRRKLDNLVPTKRWDDIEGEAHDTAFMVAGAQKADLLADLAAAVDRAITQGTSLEAFRRDFNAAVERNDWHGWTGEDTQGGRAWRTRTIYRTNTSVSYAAGRRAQLEAGNFKFWVYRHGGSVEPRPEHLSWDGVALDPDHEFWLMHYPPSDWGCSCYVVGARTAAGVRRLGGDPDKKLPSNWRDIDPKTGAPVGIGKGWDYGPGASVVQSILNKVRSWPEPIGRDFREGLPPAIRSRLFPEDGRPAITSIDQLTPEERASFVNYTRHYFREINKALRDENSLTPDAAKISDALDIAAWEKDGQVVYRGIRFDAATELRRRNLKPGDIIADPAFASTSQLKSVARKFMESDQENAVLLVITLPKEAKALYIAELSQYPAELEILLQRGTVLQVTGWDPAGIVYAKVLV